MAKAKIILAVEHSYQFLFRTYLRKNNCQIVNFHENVAEDPDLVIFTDLFSENIRKYISHKCPLLMILKNDEAELTAIEFQKVEYLREPFTELEFINTVRKMVETMIEENISEDCAKKIYRKASIKDDKINKKDKKKILVADDDIEARELINVILRAEYNVITAKDGGSLIEKAVLEKPDLIISDIVMPGLSGWRAVEKLKENPFLRDVPIIFYSSLLKDYELYNILKPDGLSAFLFKPYKSQELLDTIKQMLSE